MGDGAQSCEQALVLPLLNVLLTGTPGRAKLGSRSQGDAINEAISFSSTSATKFNLNV